jgi:putative methyltransferase (TIGR04325 family)
MFCNMELRREVTMSGAQVRRFVAELPGIRGLRRIRYERGVKNGVHWRFWGVFSSYEDAVRGAPVPDECRTCSAQQGRGAEALVDWEGCPYPNHCPRMVGYDTPSVAEQGREAYEQMYLHDYPALFWLSTLLAKAGARRHRGSLRVVDVGGHLGEKFRVFRRRRRLPDDLSWTVLETRAAVALARRLPASDRPNGLEFTTDRGTVDGADVLFASGALQYLEVDLWTLLDGVDHPPAHLVINKVPLSDRREVWTIQNVGRSVIPYHVMNRARFQGELASRGYRVVDGWEVPAFSAQIPFHPEVGTTANSGIVLTRSEDV